VPVQAVPSVFAGFEQTPLFVSQVPAEWHWSLAAQTTGFDPVHVPLWHVSVCVHPFRETKTHDSRRAGTTPASGGDLITVSSFLFHSTRPEREARRWNPPST
jgi:hypothetical protein